MLTHLFGVCLISAMAENVVLAPPTDPNIYWGPPALMIISNGLSAVSCAIMLIEAEKIQVINDNMQKVFLIYYVSPI